MEGFESMLSQIMSGSVVTEGRYAAGGTIEPDPAFEAAIVESALPTSVLIQTLETDTHSEIMMALEEFELAQIIGSTQVIIEGSGASGASMVMEGILKKFWDAIIEKIKAIGRWLKGIWNKIFKKSEEKAASPAVKEAIEHIEGRSKEAKNEGKLDEKLNKIREDAKKGVEAAINICGEDFKFIDYTALYKMFTKMTIGMSNVINLDANKVDEILDTAFKHRNLNDSNDESKKAYEDNVKRYSKYTKNIFDGKGIEITYNALGNALVGKATDKPEEIYKIIDDTAGLNDNSRLKKSETIPSASEFSPVFKAVESGTLKVEVDRAVSKVTSDLGRLVKMCEDAQRMCDSGKKCDEKVNKILTRMVAIMNTEISVSTQAMNRVWSIVYNAAGRYAGIVNRAMKYKRNKDKKKETTESTDWQMYMESGDVKEDVPEDDDATGDDKATTEGYFGGSSYTGDNTLKSYLSNFV